MSASQILQDLYSLDTSSPGISRLIYGLIRHDEEDRYLSNLEGSELARLVDFLDAVRASLWPFVCLLRNKFYRSSMPFQLQTTFTDNVCANYKPSVART